MKLVTKIMEEIITNLHKAHAIPIHAEIKKLIDDGKNVNDIMRHLFELCEKKDKKIKSSAEFLRAALEELQEQDEWMQLALSGIKK